MALLRRSIVSWSRTLRLFSTEILKNPDPLILSRKGGRAVPTFLIKHTDFKINKYLDEDKMLNWNEWIDVRKELISSDVFDITELTVDMVIVNTCLTKKRINTAMAYLQYLWDNDKDMNVSAMIHYLKLCYVRKDPEKLNETERKYLFAMYDKIREKYPVLDGSTGEYCILGISMTERWRESLELLEMIKLSCKPRSGAYSAIISASFDNNEPEMGWKFLREVVVRLNAEHRVYISYLEYCKRNFVGAELEKEIGKMFKFWGDNDVRPYTEVMDAYEKALRDLGWTTERTSIRDVGICRGCSHRLYNLQLNDEEFVKLANVVRERVIIGGDVYRRTSPKEYDSFLQLVERGKPWDIVVDGLNVSYLKKSSARPDGAPVTSVVKLCVGMGKKVLVLGRKHMVKWPLLDMNFIKKNATIFLADNGTADDPYLLYASLSSGPATMFVSRDLMRQHKFLLEDPEITRIFKYWQMTHQILPNPIMSQQRKPEIRLRKPPSYLPLAQSYEKGWHVPFTFEESLQPPTTYEPPRTWVCFRKNRKIVNSAINVP